MLQLRMLQYDEAYQAAQAVLDKYNPCQIKASGDGKLTCAGLGPDWCCEGCKHLTAMGCSVQSLACKLHLCSRVYHPEARKAMDQIAASAKVKLGFHPLAYDRYRLSKEEVFADPTY